MVARRRTPGFGQARRPQACLAHAAVQRRDLDLAGEAESAELGEIDSGSTLYDEIAVAVHVEQPVQRRGVVTRVEPSPPGSPAGGVGEHDGVAGDWPQRVGAAQLHIADVVPGHGEPDRVDVAAHHVSRPNCAVRQALCRPNT